MQPLRNKAMIKALTIFLLLVGAVLIFYILAQSSGQLARGKEVVQQKTSAIACTGVVFSVKGIQETSQGLSLTIHDEGYSNGRIETATIKSGGVARVEEVHIDPGIEKQLQLDNFRIVNNFTVSVNDCDDYANVCTQKGCGTRI